ncbi:histone deacetylase family protein [Halomarina salina]|uniref:Histone deacetylase family protein n=1 Tax=Halomarina salina TaxID=1872699 RepID=A0ABD5RL73_9EURY|nr:histone deacetylase [Halomarina salina]
MRYAYREVCLDHDTGPRHPERPDRLRAIRRALARHHGVEFTSPDDATVEAVQAVHDADYVESVREFCADGGGSWDADTVAVEATWDAALASAGGACWAAEEALDGADGNDTPFSLGRPPGHHAVYDDAMGFCFFNNAAVAAQAALDGGADGVAILDWDVHHGNGTQDIFYDRGDVFYASLHEQGLYPGTGEIDETGEGDGEQATMNLAYPAGSGDAEYADALDRAVFPVIERRDPDLFLVSAGFDAHERDPISRMRVSTEGYGLLAQQCRDFAAENDIALGYVLEGGYGLECLAESISTIQEVYMGKEPVHPDSDPNDGAQSIVDDLRDEFDL